MLARMRALCTLALSFGVFGISTSVLEAQGVPAEGFRNVVSANPLGLLFDLFNAEYERTTSVTSTIGIGGSTFSREDDFSSTESRYLNLDVFYRYYPSGKTYQGWNFGVKVGVTSIGGEGPFLGYGFDLNRSWLLGPNQRFYVGTGFGLKRLVGVEDGILAIIPTYRIINIGRAF